MVPSNLLIFSYFRKVVLFSKCPRLLAPSIKRRERGVLSFSCSTCKHLPYLCRKNMTMVVKACFYNPPVESAQNWGRLSQDTLLWSVPVSEFLEHWTFSVNTLQLNKCWWIDQCCICLMHVWKCARVQSVDPRTWNCYWKLGKPPIPSVSEDVKEVTVRTIRLLFLFSAPLPPSPKKGKQGYKF